MFRERLQEAVIKLEHDSVNNAMETRSRTVQEARPAGLHFPAVLIPPGQSPRLPVAMIHCITVLTRIQKLPKSFYAGPALKTQDSAGVPQL